MQSSTRMKDGLRTPSRRFELFLIQHSHLDLGYTERQERIEQYHRQFIRQAVAYALSPDQEARRPHERFRFLCEAFWAVERFLDHASPSDREAFEAALRAGYVELSATYLHFAELLEEQDLHDSLQAAIRYADSIGIPRPEIATSFDINGTGWGYCDALAESGVKYLSTCINMHHGGRPFGKRNYPFWWESAKGNRVLVWSGQTYHKANLYGLVPGGDSANGPGFEPGDLRQAETHLMGKLLQFEEEDYPYDFLPIYAGGLYTDNSPPTDLLCEHLRAWNEKWGEHVHIRTANPSDFFRHLEATGGDFPVHRGDWPDWWTDGVASTVSETKLFLNARRTWREIRSADPEARIVSKEQRRRIQEKLFLFAEHTWGYSASVPSPWDLTCQQILLRKAEHAAAADREVMAALDMLSRSQGEIEFRASRSLSFRVVNNLPRPRRGVAWLPIDFWEESQLREGYQIVDSEGRHHPCQKARFGRGALLATVLDVPAHGTVDLQILPDSARRGEGGQQPAAAVLGSPGLGLAWDPSAGITSIRNLHTNEEYLLRNGPSFCQPIYQVFPTPEGESTSQIRAQAGIHKLRPQSREAFGSLINASLVATGPVFSILRLEHEVEGCRFHQVELRVFHGMDRVEVSCRVNKENIWEPEGLYLAFPLTCEGASWHLDRAGGFVRPHVDQLPESCRDYYAVRDGAVLAGSQNALTWVSFDAPLVHIGGLNLWRYGNVPPPSGTLYSWQTNNKWETNFKASCGGFHEFRYSLQLTATHVGPEGLRHIMEDQITPLRVLRT